MRVLIDIPTKGDTMTMPGGIVLRQSDRDYVVHYYNTDRDTGTERDHFQGSYFNLYERDSLSKALSELARRVKRAEGYDAGGAIDTDAMEGKVPA